MNSSEVNTNTSEIMTSTFSKSDLDEALGKVDFETYMKEEEKKEREGEDFDIVNCQERYNIKLCNKILYSSASTTNSTLGESTTVLYENSSFNLSSVSVADRSQTILCENTSRNNENDKTIEDLEITLEDSIFEESMQKN